MMLGLPTQLVTDLTCAGTPFQMGIVQGQALREKIQGSIQTLANLEAVRLMKPRFLPFGWFWRLAAFKSERFLQRAFAASPLWIEQRLRGIAEGSGVPFRTLAICSAMEAALSDLGPITTIAAIAGCSAMAVSRSASRDGRPMLAHNFDYIPITQPYYFIRRSKPTASSILSSSPSRHWLELSQESMRRVCASPAIMLMPPTRAKQLPQSQC